MDTTLEGSTRSRASISAGAPGGQAGGSVERAVMSGGVVYPVIGAGAGERARGGGETGRRVEAQYRTIGV